MNPLLKLLFLAFCCGISMYSLAQSPQQTSVPEVKHFPNPAGNSNVINISFNLAAASYVNLKLFNPLGIQLKELVNGALAAGEHTIALDISSINDGVYFYTIKVNGYSETKKLTIKK